MKTALAIVCSLLLAWTQLLQAQAPAAGVAREISACCQCSSGCCAPSAPEPQPLTAAPASFSSQNPLPTLAPPALLWILPSVPARECSPGSVSSSGIFDAPLFERNCVRLI